MRAPFAKTTPTGTITVRDFRSPSASISAAWTIGSPISVVAALWVTHTCLAVASGPLPHILIQGVKTSCGIFMSCSGGSLGEGWAAAGACAGAPPGAGLAGWAGWAGFGACPNAAEAASTVSNAVATPMKNDRRIGRADADTILFAITRSSVLGAPNDAQGP